MIKIYTKTHQTAPHFENSLRAATYAPELPSICAGASPGFGRGGGPRNVFPDLEICMLRSDMLRMAKPCALLGGFGGMLPREIFLKWCNLVRFGVYFDLILASKNFKNYHFLYKNLKIAIFYIKE